MLINISLDSLPQFFFLISCKNDLVRDTSCLRFPSCKMQRELLNQTLVKFHHGGIIFSPLTHIYPYTTPTFVGFIPRIVVCSPPRSDSGSILKFCLKPAVLCVIHRWESHGLCQNSRLHVNSS